MARSKPTRSIELTYAKVRQTNDDGTLFPCFIAPRYILHRLAKSNTYAGVFNAGSANQTMAFPDRATDDTSKVDRSQVSVKLTKAVLQVASGISVSAHATAQNCLVFKQAVVGADKDEALKGYEVKVGDFIVIDGLTATITDIRKDTSGTYREVYVNISGFNIDENTTVDIYTGSLTSDAILVEPVNYTVSEAGITFKENTLSVDLYKTSYMVKSADVNIEYRELVTTDTFELMPGDSEGLKDFVGDADPANPLGFFAYCAQLAGTYAFYVMSVPNDDYSSYEKALNIAMRYENVFAPFTYNQTESVRQLLIQRMNEYNDPSIAQFKKLWFADNTDSMATVYNKTTDGQTLKITMTAEGAATFTDGDLYAAGIIIGSDVLVIPSYYDPETQKYSRKEYIIDSIVDTGTLMVRGNAVTITEQTTAYIARSLSNTAYAEVVAGKAFSLNSPYINYVWADDPVCLGYGKTDTIFLAATLAALRSKNAPHAPLSEVAVPGWTVSDTRGMSESDLDIMNNKGVWIVHKDRYGEVVTRHQLTTVQDGTLAEEDSAVSNACNIVRSLRSMLYQYRGDSNVTSELIDALNADIRQSLDRIMARIYPVKIGKQVVDYSIKDIKIDDDNRARIILDVDIDVPEPLLDGHFKFNII
jgi:hypothetical protein